MSCLMCEPERPGGYGICPRTPDGCGEFEAWLYRDPRSGWSLEFGRESECMSVGASFGVAHCPWCGRRLDDPGGAPLSALLDELADCVQACCNLAHALGCSDMRPYMARCEGRNRERGRL